MSGIRSSMESKARVVVATGPIPPSPQAVGAVVQLDGREQPLVVGVALRDSARAHGVVVLTGLREPVAHAKLQRVVHERQEAQLAPASAGLAALLDLGEKIGYVGAHRALRVPGPRLPPGQAETQLGILRDGSLELGLRRESGNEAGAERLAGHRHYSTRSATQRSPARARMHVTLVAVAADRDELGAVLLDAGPIVHEHEMQVVVVPSRSATRRLRRVRPAPSPPGASRGRPRAPAPGPSRPPPHARRRCRPGGARVRGRPGCRR